MCSALVIVLMLNGSGLSAALTEAGEDTGNAAAAVLMICHIRQIVLSSVDGGVRLCSPSGDPAVW
jgi:hypothetical protein